MVLVDPVEVNDEVTTVAATTEAPGQSQQVDTQVDDGLPEKFRGKSPTEIADAYRNLETELGRARNEIGTNRRLVDELLNLRRSAEVKSAPEPVRVTPYDLAENPEETITTVAKRVADERSAASEQRLAKIEQDLEAERFEKKRPGFRNTLSSTDFQKWLQESPLRVRLVTKAAEGDWDAGDEVMELYDQYKAAKPAEAPSKTTDAAKQAGLAKSGGSGANKVVQGGDGKKVYSRAELARMYINNPEEYARLSDSGELGQAYKEKRVR
jgi:hypothetical protein